MQLDTAGGVSYCAVSSKENQMRYFIICTFEPVLFGMLHHEDEMGIAHSTHGREEKSIQICGGKKLHHQGTP
jgi:hypothetical protein